MPEAGCQHIWDPEGGGPEPCALSSWDLPCHLPPWRPAGPEEGQEQLWALRSRGRKSRAHPSDSILFSQVSLGYSCSQPAPSCPWERAAWFSEPRSPQSHSPASLHFVFITCSHQGDQGRARVAPGCGSIWKPLVSFSKEAPDSQSPQGGDDKDQMGSPWTRVTCALNAPVFPGSVPAVVMVIGRWGQGCDMSHGEETSSFSNLHKPWPHGAPVATIQGLRGTVNPMCSPMRLVLSPPPSLWGPAKDLGTVVEAPAAPGLSGTQGPLRPLQGRILLYA